MTTSHKLEVKRLDFVWVICIIITAVILSDMFADKLDERIIKIGGLIEYLHTASLIIDDIEDSSILRR